MEYKTINDNELLYLISDNNDEYKKILYDKYKPIVIACAKKYYQYNKDNSIDLDDFIQDGLIALDNACRFYKQDSNLFYTYACYCINLAMSKELKKVQYKKRYKMAINRDFNDNLKIDSYLIDEMGESSVNDYFVMLKNNINYYDSLVLELRINGFSYKEIAKLLDISVKKVDYSIQKIRRNLKKYL